MISYLPLGFAFVLRIQRLPDCLCKLSYEIPLAITDPHIANFERFGLSA